MWFWALIAILCGVGITGLMQFLASGKTHRTLASRQPARRETEIPLGMEALDLDEISRTNRRNESYERGQTNWLSKSGFFGQTDIDIKPLADDETYAARFYSAFQNDRSKD